MAVTDIRTFDISRRSFDQTNWLFARPVLSTEWLAVLASVFFTLCCNGIFWRRLIGELHVHAGFTILIFVIIVALQAFLLGLVLTRRSAKPILTILFIATAFAVYYMSAYKVYMDADMIRNVLHTDPREASELLVPGLILPLVLLGALPTLVLWRLRFQQRTLKRAAIARTAFLFGSLLVVVAGAALGFKDLSAMLRNQRELRYLVTPVNYVTSLSRVLLASPPGVRKTLVPVGEDARHLPHPPGSKPRLLVLVLGETVRARNFGLDGYSRQTTPQLAAMNEVINFNDTRSCGTSTEVSVPCMFSPFGRHDYNESKIRSHESLLKVLDRAGIATFWRDNQSGCKGVCAGLPFESVADRKDPGLCNDTRCMDEILLSGLDKQFVVDGRDQVIVLHQLGNHGPAYFQRYPASFRKFTPTCDSEELGNCTQQQIINSYDNAVLYTDHFLASTIDFLKRQDAYDTGMIYVSDHGESLGEKGLFLHGVPYSIAPEEQTHVPMVMWMSPGLADSAKLDLACLRRESGNPGSHDNLFPSILGLMDVQTSAYDRSRDLYAGCRRQSN